MATQIYRAYETKNGKAIKVLREGEYEVISAWAQAREAKVYAETKVHSPIWVDCILHSIDATA
jgi:predicted nuclease with RNAse H fold